MNTDFDALASMVAAKKLYPDATLVLSDKQQTIVKQFLNIYRDIFQFATFKDIVWKDVTHLIIVDVASLQRIGHFPKEFQANEVKMTIYDHHPPHKHDLCADESFIEQVGSTVTLLIEEIRKKELQITEF